MIDSGFSSQPLNCKCSGVDNLKTIVPLNSTIYIGLDNWNIVGNSRKNFTPTGRPALDIDVKKPFKNYV